MDDPPISKPDTKSGRGTSNSSASESSQISNSYPFPNFDGPDLNYYTEEQLEDLLLEKFEFLYNEAISKIIELGFDQDLALKGLLMNGHIYGENDVFSNIFHNALGYLTVECTDNNNNNKKNSVDSKLVCDDLKELGEYSLGTLVGILQKVKPHLTKGNAMWSLLMSNLDVGRAVLMEVPVLRSPRNVESLGNNPVGVDPFVRRLNAGLGYAKGGNSDFRGNMFPDVTLLTEIENPKRFSLSPKKKSLLKENVAIFAAGFKSALKAKDLVAQSHDMEIRNSDNQDGVSSILGRCLDLNLDENVNVGEDQKNEMILRLMDALKYLERRVKEVQEWAQEKGIQTAKANTKHTEAQSHDGEIRNLDNQDGVNAVLGKLRDLNLDENVNVGVDKKDEVVSILIDNIKDLEREIKEMKEWVQEEAKQAAEANSKHFEAQSHDGEIRNLDNQSILGKFRYLNLDDENLNVGEDHKDDEVVSRLIDEIKDLERQVKEKKEWAQEKALQAAKKLSGDLIEFRILRMVKEETKKLNKRKHRLEETTMNRVSDMEYAMRKISGEEEKANEAVRKLAADKAEIIAEMEAIKLSASEADSECLQVKKREKKYQNRISGCEKQKARLQEESAAEKQKLSELKQELARIREAQKQTEVKWRQEQKAKELAQEQVVEERRLKKQTVINNKTKHEALRQNIEIEFKIHDDDLQRLEQKLSQSKATSQPTDVLHKSDNFSQPKITGKEIIGDRVCMFCKKYQVSVVYLPCSHQVLCASCDDLYQKTGRAVCLLCCIPIEQRIRVLGVSS